MIDAIRKIFPSNKDKEVMGVMIMVAYTDGTFDQTAILPDAEYDFNINLVSDLLSHGVRALLDCYSETPSALNKLVDVVA